MNNVSEKVTCVSEKVTCQSTDALLFQDCKNL